MDITSCCGINSAKLSSWINDSGFNLVLTGTSAYHLLEREIWKACELIGIKTFCHFRPLVKLFYSLYK